MSQPESAPEIARQVRQQRGDIESLHELVEQVDGKVDALDTKIDGVDGRVVGLEGRFDRVDVQLAEILRRLAG